MMRSLYGLATWALQPFVRRKLNRRAVVEPLYGEHMAERFGCYTHFDKLSASGVGEHANRPLIWIHAVSLGETRAAAILLKELRLTMPTMRLLLTSGTATGRAEGVKLLLDGDIQVWQPWDTRSATRSFFAHFQPALGILMETEIWPNLIASANAAHVPVALVNARMSDKSLKQSMRWYVHWLASQAYRGLAAVYAQTQDDAARLAQLGGKVAGVFGNLKFDITPNADQVAAGDAFRLAQAKPIILFASSREGEEALFLEALQALPPAQQGAVHWLIVPRHPQRFDEVAGLIEAAGFVVSRRSQSADFGKLSPNGFYISTDLISSNDHGTDANPMPCRIWLGDSIGEMAVYYSLASAALLGGSFAKLGGQNLIEALACGCPVVMGPHTFNFEEAASLAAASNVGFQVEGMASAVQCALQQGAFDRRKAVQFVQAHCGAARQTAAALALVATVS
jgi:3-deoxy-D-manno-octulosonic-acid transferase